MQFADGSQAGRPAYILGGGGGLWGGIEGRGVIEGVYQWQRPQLIITIRDSVCHTVDVTPSVVYSNFFR